MKTELVELKGAVQIPVTVNTQFVAVPSSDESSLELIFEKEGVDAELLVLYHLKKGEVRKFRTSCIHKAPNTSCIIKVRGVLEDNSHSDFIGKIIIEKNAQKTNAYLQDNVLVAGKNTKNTSAPVLQIDANDVKASHGATTGRVNKDEVFYLMSRGLNNEEAQQIITKGFFEKILSTIKDDKIREGISETL